MTNNNLENGLSYTIISILLKVNFDLVLNGKQNKTSIDEFLFKKK